MNAQDRNLAKIVDAISSALIPQEIEKPTLKEFIADAWHLVEPNSSFISGWHIDIITEHLEAASRREIKNLLINIPPRHGKSFVCSVFFPAWSWIQIPGEKFLCSSYSQRLATDHSVYCRRVVESAWYESRWGSVFKIIKSADTAFGNDKGGYRVATSVGGYGTGSGGTVLIVDDPHNVKEAPSKAKRAEVLAWWTQSMSTRINPPKEKGIKIIIMQRCHEMDLSGYILANSNEFEHLCIPAEYDPRRIVTTSLNWKDPRELDEEILWPKGCSKKYMEEQKKVLGSYGFAGQFQQTPTPPKGGIVQRDWWKFWDETEIQRDMRGDLNLDDVIQSWDMSFKGTAESDYVVGQVWGRRGANKYLLDQVRRRLSFPDTVKAVINMNNKWPETTAILVEDKTNGPAIISQLQREISGLIPVNPQGDKVGRLQSVSPQIESRNVYLPRRSSWVDDYIEEFAAATPDGGGQYWDQIDATSQALLRLGISGRKLTWGRTKSTGDKEHTSGPKRKTTFGRRRITVISEKRGKPYRF